MTGAFLFGGGFWLIVAAYVVLGLLMWWEARRAPYDTDLWDDADGPVPGADERRARTTLYGLRSYERRTDNVVPRNTQRWS